MVYQFESGDVLTTINGLILQVIRSSENYVYLNDITNDCKAIYSKIELCQMVKEIYYV